MKVKLVETRIYSVPSILEEELRKAMDEKDTDTINEIVGDIETYGCLVSDEIESIVETKD